METRQILSSMWKGRKKGDEEDNDKKFVVYQAAVHSRYALDEQVHQYMRTTAHLGQAIREELVSGCIKACIAPNEYHDAQDFLDAIKEILGVFVYMDIRPAPRSSRTPFLNEINVAHLERQKVMSRVDHPGASFVKKGLFYFIN